MGGRRGQLLQRIPTPDPTRPHSLLNLTDFITSSCALIMSDSFSTTKPAWRYLVNCGRFDILGVWGRVGRARKGVCQCGVTKPHPLARNWILPCLPARRAAGKVLGPLGSWTRFRWPPGGGLLSKRTKCGEQRVLGMRGKAPGFWMKSAEACNKQRRMPGGVPARKAQHAPVNRRRG